MRIQRIIDNDADYVDPQDMIAELREDNVTLTGRLREVHNVRRASRYRYREPHLELDRRDRTAYVVPVRIESEVRCRSSMSIRSA